MDQHQHDSSVEAAPVSERLEESGDLVIMGNVQVLSQNNTGDLTQFQRNKLLFDFNTFFDLNNDGYLSYKVKFQILSSLLWKNFKVVNRRYLLQRFFNLYKTLTL